jgi:hypothetical protein
MHVDYRDGVMRIELPRATEQTAMLTDGTKAPTDDV